MLFLEYLSIAVAATLVGMAPLAMLRKRPKLAVPIVAVLIGTAIPRWLLADVAVFYVNYPAVIAIAVWIHSAYAATGDASRAKRALVAAPAVLATLAFPVHYLQADPGALKMQATQKIVHNDEANGWESRDAMRGQKITLAEQDAMEAATREANKLSQITKTPRYAPLGSRPLVRRGKYGPIYVVPMVAKDETTDEKRAQAPYITVAIDASSSSGLPLGNAEWRKMHRHVQSGDVNGVLRRALGLTSKHGRPIPLLGPKGQIEWVAKIMATGFGKPTTPIGLALVTEDGEVLRFPPDVAALGRLRTYLDVGEEADDDSEWKAILQHGKANPSQR